MNYLGLLRFDVAPAPTFFKRLLVEHDPLRWNQTKATHPSLQLLQLVTNDQTNHDRPLVRSRLTEGLPKIINAGLVRGRVFHATRFSKWVGHCLSHGRRVADFLFTKMKPTCLIVCATALLLSGCSKPEPKIEDVRAENLKRAAKVKADEEQVELFKLAAELSAVLLQRAETSGQLSNEGNELQSAAEMEAALIKKTVRKEEVRQYAALYVFNMRKLIEIVRDKMPEKKQWADRMQPLLLNLEAAAM